MNSTPGLILMFSHREPTRGAWIEFKKPVLHRLPVLDVASLGRSLISKLSESSDDIAVHALATFSEPATDATRKQIDDELDSALQLPDTIDLREMLSRESIVSLNRI